METALEVVNRFYDITNNRKGEGLDQLVAQDMTFEGPLMRTRGAREYLALNAQLLPFHRGTRMLRQFATGGEVCSIYEMTLATPTGGAVTLEIADWIKVKDGRVAGQRIYYDPREFAKAFGM